LNKSFIKESRWSVSLTPAGPQAKPVQKQVEAPTQDAAVRRAMQAFPGMQFVQVQATALDPQEVPPGQRPMQQQQQMPRAMVGMKGLQQLKQPGQPQQPQGQPQAQTESRFTYPYAIRLPSQFSRVLQDTSPVVVTEAHGQYQITLRDHAELQEFLNRLQTHRNRGVATMVLNGIKSSRFWGNSRD